MVARTPRSRSQLSVVLLVLQVAATALHKVPSLVYPRTTPTTTRVIVYISHLGPWWVLAFGASAVALLGALALRRAREWAHVACAGVWVMYASSLWIGAFGASPRGTVLFPCVTTAMAVLHVIIAASYNETTGVEARRKTADVGERAER